MKKRRIFDLDMPDEPVEAPIPAPAPIPETFPAGKIEAEPAPVEPRERTRRGPMAMAVKENADALRARAEAESSIREENDALAREFVRLKGLGLIVDLIPVEAIDTYKLVRDRLPGEDEELGELKASIADIGLSNPIRVAPSGAGRYELVQGFRRLSAYRELLAETGDPRYARIPAGLMTDSGGLEALYRRMVDENLVRKDVSFAEMAALARDYASDPETDCDDPDKAVAILFKSAGYQKRSYIRAFVTVMERLGEDLRYPGEMPRNLGLELRRRIETEEGVVPGIREALPDWETRTVEEELAVLRRFAGVGEGARTFPAGKVEEPAAAAGPRTRKAKVTFDVPRAQGLAKCTAANGRLEIRLPLDFSTLDRRRVEEAVRQMLDQIS